MSETCPKCGRPARPADVSCARCGLLRERWAGFSPKPPPHPLLDPLWDQAVADWQDEQRHKALAAVVTATQDKDWTVLSALAQRYNAVLRQRPDDAVAQRSLDGLIQRAMRLPPPAPPPGRPASVQALRAAAGVLLVLLSGYLFYALWHRPG